MNRCLANRLLYKIGSHLSISIERLSRSVIDVVGNTRVAKQFFENLNRLGPAVNIRFRVIRRR
ncbi:MAG: hypothetical protein DMF63_11325 [Acidobacteria bacterium]|nr:MAG: hypothetical protein DMF63_11325 [Acidobacteriota bacterium]